MQKNIVEFQKIKKNSINTIKNIKILTVMEATVLTLPLKFFMKVENLNILELGIMINKNDVLLHLG